jgi:hypothetical protein
MNRNFARLNKKRVVFDIFQCNTTKLFAFLIVY